MVLAAVSVLFSTLTSNSTVPTVKVGAAKVKLPAAVEVDECRAEVHPMCCSRNGSADSCVEVAAHVDQNCPCPKRPIPNNQSARIEDRVAGKGAGTV